MPLSKEQAARNRFRRQWALLPAGDFSLQEWSRTEIGGRVLLTHPDTDLAVKDVGGKPLVVIGVAYDTAARSAVSAPTSAPHGPSADEVTDWVRGLSGVYAVVSETPDRGVLVFADPGGIMGVYTDGNAIASTPALWPLFTDDAAQATAEAPPYPLSETNDWYTGEATQRSGVRSLLANHLLDAGSGTTERYWPLGETPVIETEEAIERVADEFRGAVLAIVSAYPALLSVTGGRDSRVYAAACGGDGRAFTIVRGSLGARDAEIAERICAVNGLKHEVLTAGPVPSWLDELFDQMTGGLVPPHRRRILEACARLASGDAVHVNGNLGGLATAFYWAGGEPTSVRPADLVRDFAGVRAEAERGVRHWLASTGPLHPRTLCNLMYMEQRASRWMGPGETASSLFYASFTPFSSRTFFECYDGCPASYQHSGRFLVDVAERLDPGLAMIPYASGTTRLRRLIPTPLKVALKNWMKR